MSAGSVFAAEGNTWTGFNVYGGIGYNTLQSKEETTNYSIDTDNMSYFSGTHSKSKFSGILGVGYDSQINDKLVVGVFADINFANPKTDTSSVGYYGNYTYNTSASVKDAMSLGLKLGFQLGANDLVYVSGGVSRAKVEVMDYEGLYYNNPISVTTSKHKTGKFIGLGLEHKLNDKLSVTADYRVTDYGTVNADGYYNGNTASIQHSSKLKTQDLSLNLKYKF
jgi:outer membrane immunogenic protein